jgi:hypothetical protein
MRVTAAALLIVAAFSLGGQRRPLFIPIGVIDDRPGESAQRGLSELTKLRFTVVGRRDPSADPPRHIRVEALPGLGLPPEALPPPSGVGGIEIVAVRKDSSASQVRRDAWVLIGRGFRGVLFDGWTTLRQNPDGLAAAAAFADVITRNTALFAPLSVSARAVGIDGATGDFFARFVESDEAMVLVAANLTDSVQTVTLKFSPDTPEAIWQNMEAGGAVDFVAGPEGPIYSRVFPPHDVVVFMIRKQYK